MPSGLAKRADKIIKEQVMGHVISQGYVEQSAPYLRADVIASMNRASIDNAALEKMVDPAITKGMKTSPKN